MCSLYFFLLYFFFSTFSSSSFPPKLFPFIIFSFLLVLLSLCIKAKLIKTGMPFLHHHVCAYVWMYKCFFFCVFYFVIGDINLFSRYILLGLSLSLFHSLMLQIVCIFLFFWVCKYFLSCLINCTIREKREREREAFKWDHMTNTTIR